MSKETTKVQKSPNKRLITQRKKFASQGLIKPVMPKGIK